MIGGVNTRRHAVKVHNTIQSIRNARKSLLNNVRVGFVPTMGALHDGHKSLLQKARENNDVVISSIFVNPTQFGPNEDLDKYPRTVEKDLEVLNEVGVDHVFVPDDISSMYGPHHVTFVDPRGFDDIPEGSHRPGHFCGVATIVTKLFNIVQPTHAYFGQKDAAQCVLIKRIVQDLNMDIEVIICDIVREEDGLAMSSRNVYLDADERRAARILSKSLHLGCDLHQQAKDAGAIIPSKVLKKGVIDLLQSEPLVVEIQYVALDCMETMQPVEQAGAVTSTSNQEEEGGAPKILSLAVKMKSGVRLIDNMILS